MMITDDARLTRLRSFIPGLFSFMNTASEASWNTSMPAIAMKVVTVISGVIGKSLSGLCRYVLIGSRMLSSMPARLSPARSRDRALVIRMVSVLISLSSIDLLFLLVHVR